MELFNRAVLFAAVSVIAFSGCVRNTIDDDLPAEIEGLTVPASFNWSSLEAPTLTVIPEDTHNGVYYYQIEVFDGNPVIDTSAVLLAKGVAKKNQPFVTTLVKPAMTKVLYVRQTDPRRLETLQTVVVDGSGLICDFSDTTELATPLAPPVQKPMPVALRAAENQTPTNAIPLNTNMNDDITLLANKAYVIPAGYTYTGKITFSASSSLYVEGELAVADAKVPQLAATNVFVIQPEGRFSIPGTASLPSYSGTVYNYGSMIVRAISFTSKAQLVNKGTLIVNEYLSFTDKDNAFTNDGIASFGAFRVTNGNVVNNGTMTVDGLLYTNGASLKNTNFLQAGQATTTGSTWYIHCGTYVTGVLLDESGTLFDMKTGTILKVGTFNGSGSEVRMPSTAMMVANTAIFNGNSSTINGTGTKYALCRFGRVIPGNGTYKAIYYKGRVEIECSDHYQGTSIYTPFYVAESRVRWAEAGAATTVIPATSCNDEGNTVNPPYPTPENPGFPLQVPAASVYTFIMEDNWPAVADYDMNDLVVKFSLAYTQNSSNLVTGMKITYTLLAVGAKKSIAAAVQLDEVTPAQVEAVTYGTGLQLTGKIFPREQAGYESGQSKVVIPLFDDAHKVLNSSIQVNTMLNTYKDAQKFTPVTNTVSVLFKQAVIPASVNIMKLNFFIVPDGVANAISRTEIHLSGFHPTDKVDGSRFGKYYDNSVKGAWYTTPGNLVWGILVPAEFKYPAETKSIVKAYPDFSTWCTSGGSQQTSWYLNPSTETGLIY